MSYDALMLSLHNPSNEFTPIPFWFWNDELSNAEIERQTTNIELYGSVHGPEGK